MISPLGLIYLTLGFRNRLQSLSLAEIAIQQITERLVRPLYIQQGLCRIDLDRIIDMIQSLLCGKHVQFGFSERKGDLMLRLVGFQAGDHFASLSLIANLCQQFGERSRFIKPKIHLSGRNNLSRASCEDGQIATAGNSSLDLRCLARCHIVR